MHPSSQHEDQKKHIGTDAKFHTENTITDKTVTKPNSE